MEAITYIIKGVIKSIENSPTIRGIIAALLLALLGLVVWVNQSNRTARRQAGDRIIAGFQPELDALIQTDKDARLILTDEIFKKHESIIRNNKRDLTYLQQFRLSRAWHDLAYYQIDKKRKVPFYSMYADCGSLDKRRKMPPLAIARIQKIISIVS